MKHRIRPMLDGVLSMNRDDKLIASSPQPGDQTAEYPYVKMFSMRLDFDELRRIRNESISDTSLSEVDHKIERTCRAYTTATDQQRALYRQNMKNGWSLLHFAERMATRALRTKDVELLRLAISSLSLEDLRHDPRDTVSSLAVLRYVALAIGADWDRIVEEILQISSCHMIEFVHEFSAREPDSLRLDNFLRRETLSVNGPTIERFSPVYDAPRKKNRPWPSTDTAWWKPNGVGWFVEGD